MNLRAGGWEVSGVSGLIVFALLSTLLFGVCIWQAYELYNDITERL